MGSFGLACCIFFFFFNGWIRAMQGVGEMLFFVPALAEGVPSLRQETCFGDASSLPATLHCSLAL